MSLFESGTLFLTSPGVRAEHPGMYIYCAWLLLLPALAGLPPRPPTAAPTRVCIPESAARRSRKAGPVENGARRV